MLHDVITNVGFSKKALENAEVLVQCFPKTDQIDFHVWSVKIFQLVYRETYNSPKHVKNEYFQYKLVYFMVPRAFKGIKRVKIDLLNNQDVAWST